MGPPDRREDKKDKEDKDSQDKKDKDSQEKKDKDSQDKKDKSKDSKEEKDNESQKDNEGDDELSSKEKKQYVKDLIKKLKKGDECDEDDVYPDVRDCRKYYRCEVKNSGKHKFAHLRCDKKERFDWLAQSCVPKDEARCLEK